MRLNPCPALPANGDDGTKGLTLTTNSDGAANFRGFHGRYDVRVTLPDGRRETLTLHLRGNEENRWVFQL